MDLGLTGRAVLVTGGSRGIGLETARLFAREGAHVLIAARREAGPGRGGRGHPGRHRPGHRDAL